MKRVLTVCSCFLLLANACGKNETIGDPSFYFNFTVSNPAQSFKLSLNIRPHPTVKYSGLIYIQRIQGNSSITDYRENGILRLKMLDTMSLDPETFERFSTLIRKAHIWEQQNSIGRRTDGNAYHFMLKDSLRGHAFSLMGKSENEYLQELTTFCMELFNTYYPQIPLNGIHSEIDLIKFDRIHTRTDSAQIRIVKYGDAITVFKNQETFTLTPDQFIDLWRVLENNRIWELSSSAEFSSKYPVEYRLSVRRDNLRCSFEVYAPSKLTDKRYFEVINFIETLTPANINVHDFKR